MKKLLTPSLLLFLINSGYTHCLSKSLSSHDDDNELFITLKPVKYQPVIKRLPTGYDTFFEITEEPIQMARKHDDKLVLVDMSDILPDQLTAALTTN